jgi:hypothetical protein
MHGANDLEDVMGHHLLLHRLFNEDTIERHAHWWSAIDSNNVVDLDGPAPPSGTSNKSGGR